MHAPSYDHVFRNALIYDGTRRAAVRRRARDRRRAHRAWSAAGTIPPGAGADEHDLRGRALSPGFIDTHTHDDRIVLDAPDMLPKISQGVTTVVTGNCGISLAPVTFKGEPPAPMNLLGAREGLRIPDLRRLRAARSPRRCRRSTSPRSIGHSALRLATMSDIRVKASDGGDRRHARPRRRGDGERRRRVSRPGSSIRPTPAPTSTRCRASPARFAKHGGVYATHMRSEMEHGARLHRRDAGDRRSAPSIPVVISHHKCAGPQNWGRTRETLPVIEAAAKQQPVGLDAYPYTAGSTNLRADLVTDEFRIMITWSRPHPEATGRDLADIAAEWGVDHPRGGAPARSGRRDLFPDGRGRRRAACSAFR